MFSKDVIGLKGLRMETCSKKDISLGEQGKASSYEIKISKERLTKKD